MCPSTCSSSSNANVRSLICIVASRSKPGVYLAALGTDWLQQAYLFVLLREYHQERFVVKMYLAGVASQLSLSVLLEVIGGFIPHKSRCATCLALQAGSAAFLVHPAYGGLVTSRVLGGFAAALLHSSFEAWMVEQVIICVLTCFHFCYTRRGFHDKSSHLRTHAFEFNAMYNEFAISQNEKNINQHVARWINVKHRTLHTFV